MQRLILAALASLVVVLGAGLASAQPARPFGPEGVCRAAAARFAVGRLYTEQLARRARRRAGARVLRRREPGGIYTMEIRPDRLNLDVDRRGRIRAVQCG